MRTDSSCHWLDYSFIKPQVFITLNKVEKHDISEGLYSHFLSRVVKETITWNFKRMVKMCFFKRRRNVIAMEMS